MEANNTVNLIIGKRGSGKTAYAKGDPQVNKPNLYDVYVSKGMKVLNIDTFDHPSYQNIKLIQPKQINLNWKQGVYRCFVNVNEIDALIDIVSENVWNTALFFEDAHKHQHGKLNRAIMRLIGDSKQKNVDLYFMYHNWALVPKDLYRYLDYIEIFKTKDSPEARKNDMPGCYDDVLQTWQKVMADQSPFAHLTVDCG